MQILKIKFLTSAAGKDTAFKKGGEYSLPFDEAKSFLFAKIAVPVIEKKETAVNEVKEVRNVKTGNSPRRRTANANGSKNTSKAKRK